MSTAVKWVNSSGSITNARFENFENAIIIENSTSVQIDKSHFKNIANPVLVNNSNDINILNSKFENSKVQLRNIHKNDKKILAKHTHTNISELEKSFESENQFKNFIKNKLPYLQVLATSTTISKGLYDFINFILSFK